MITVKAGGISESADNPPGDAVVENNDLWKENFKNTKSFPGDTDATRFYNNRSNGIAIETDHVTVRNNCLYNKKTGEGGGLRILVAAGGDILIEQNEIRQASEGPNLGHGIEINLGRLFGSQVFVRNNQIEGIRSKGAGSGELPPAVGIKFVLPEPIKEWPVLSSPVTDILVLGNVFRNLNQTGDDKEYGVYVIRKGDAAAVFTPEALEELKDSVINETFQNSFDSSVRIENRFVIEPDPAMTDGGTTVS